MLKVQNISKSFGTLQALQDVSFEVGRGEVIGVLGRNGAGKTTLMRILTSYLRPTSGTVLLNGMDVQKHSMQIRRNIGYLPETPPLYENMTVKAYIKFAMDLKDVARKEQHKQIPSVLAQCHLESVSHKLIGVLSKGYRQRVGIAQALIGEPDLLILDEPTSGLDPQQVLQVRLLIKQLAEARTVILSTHHLSEIEQCAQRLFIIREGQLICDRVLKAVLKEQRCSLETFFLRQHGVEVV